MSGISRDEWLSALKVASGPEIDQGAMTTMELAEVFGKGKSAMNDLLRKMKAAGKVTLARKRIIDNSGRQQYVAAYRLVK